MTPRSFCVAGAICSMPSRSSRDLDPGVACDSTSFFVWQASEKFCWYICQRLVVTLRPFCVACAIISRPSDPTHRLGRVTSDLFVALAIPKHLPWPDLHSDRLWPYRPICHPRHGFCVAGATISMPLRCCPLTLYMLVGKGRKWLTVTLCGRRNIFNASEKYFVTQCLATLVTLCLATLVTLLAFCVAGAVFSMAPRSSWCIRSACVAGAILY